MRHVIYSINKRGFELDYWMRELSQSSDAQHKITVFNHGSYLDPQCYIRAQLLDGLWYAQDSRLMRMYADLTDLITQVGADAIVVDNCFPYHPEFLRTIPFHKVLRTSDGPMASYDRDFAYAHAYDQVLYHSRAYSKDLSMPEKLAYLGVRRADFWPLALFDVAFDADATEEQLFARTRDIDILFVGALHVDKMPLLAKVKKVFGRRCRLHGLASTKKNVYFNAKFGAPGWVRPISFDQYKPLYQRTKIGFNVHLRGDYTVGGYRLFDVPANGAMQISDGGEYLNDFYDVGREVARYASTDDLIGKLDYYLTHEKERIEIARAGRKRAMQSHRIKDRMKELGVLIDAAIAAK